MSLVKKTKNTCHSLNRFTCYKEDNSINDQITVLSHKTTKANLFYNSTEFALEVLVGSYLKLSFGLLILFLNMILY